jgi:DNA-binding IclR family transcriptional regulator
MAQGTKDYSVPALEKAIAILNALAANELTISDLHSRLKFPKTTTFVILNTLEQHEIVRKTAEGKYRLGPGVLHWGNRYFDSMDMVQIARPHLERLVEEKPYTGHLAVLIGDKPVYCDKVEGNGFVRFATTIGQSQPLHQSSVGKALAAGLSDEEIRLLLPDVMGTSTIKSIRYIEKFLEEVQFVRENGFAIEDEEFEEGVRCIGAPIRNYTGHIIASLSITALSKDLPAVKFMVIGEEVKQTAELISRDLGYTGNLSRSQDTETKTTSNKI